MEPTTIPAGADVQASAPTVHVSLSRVGVTNVEKVIRIGVPGSEQLYYAKLDCFVDLGPKQKGAHMSRFEEVVNDVIGEVVLGESGFKAEQLAEHIAEPELVEPLGLGPADVTRSRAALRIGVLVMLDQRLPVLVSRALHGVADLRPGVRHVTRVSHRAYT